MATAEAELVRHGEIMLVPIAATKIPKGKDTKTDRYIVGHSDNGHHHVLVGDDMTVTEGADGETYILLGAAAELVHEKQSDRHETITVEPGAYKRYHDTEYDPFAKVIRDVAD